jgi:hypothetical protein
VGEGHQHRSPEACQGKDKEAFAAVHTAAAYVAEHLEVKVLHLHGVVLPIPEVSKHRHRRQTSVSALGSVQELQKDEEL